MIDIAYVKVLKVKHKIYYSIRAVQIYVTRHITQLLRL